MIERAVAVKHNPDVRIRFDEDSRWLFPHVRALFYEINQNIPSFCGMTVYGSRVKWEGTSTSDIDGNFFFDAPERDIPIILPAFQKLLEKLTPQYTGRTANTLWWRDARDDKKISVICASVPTLVESTEVILKQISENPHAQSFNELLKDASTTDAYLIVTDLFHFSIGAKIGKLRRVVFDTLMTNQKYRSSDRYWQMLMKKLSEKERHLDTFFREVAFSHFPQSIQEGMKYFCI